MNRQGKSTGCGLLKVWKVFRVEPADGLPQTHKVVSGEQLTQDHSFQKSLIISSQLTTGSVLVVLSSPHDSECVFSSANCRRSFSVSSHHLLYLDVALGWLGYVPNRSREMKLNEIRQKNSANHSLYLWKTLLTKSAVTGFQL